MARILDGSSDPIFDDVSGADSLAALGDSLSLTLTGQAGAAVALTDIGAGVLEVTFEGSVDGANFFSLSGTNQATGVQGTTATANGLWLFATAGLARLRVRVTAWTSGHVNVDAKAGQGSGVPAFSGAVTLASDIEVNDDEDTNLDGTSGLVTDSVLYGRISDTLVKPVKLDGSSHALITVDNAHHEIHEGDSYFFGRFQDLPASDVWDLRITTPNTAEQIHMIYKVDVESETRFSFYEGVTILTAGTARTPRNHNRNFPDASGVTLDGITNADVATANLDTGIGAATLLVDHILGVGGGTPGSVQGRDEMVLKSNTIYCMRAEVTAAAYVNFQLSWYEHEAKD
jgi:hypothetical protein